MSPPIHKDWWLAAALTGAALPAAVAQPANADRHTAVVTTVTQAVPGSAASSTMYLAAASGQRLTTGPNQTLHVLFSDQSALTVGPDSEVVIADYRFDAQSKEGSLLVNMTKGLLRVVGGLISKRSDTRVRTPTATIGIRGGITLIEVGGNSTNGIFLFGSHMTMAAGDGGSGQTTNRPGFGTSVGPDGIVQGPYRVPANTLTGLLQQLEQKPLPTPAPSPAPVDPNAGGKPEDTIANDRLKERDDATNNIDPGRTLEDLLKSTAPPSQS